MPNFILILKHSEINILCALMSMITSQKSKTKYTSKTQKINYLKNEEVFSGGSLSELFSNNGFAYLIKSTFLYKFNLEPVVSFFVIWLPPSNLRFPAIIWPRCNSFEGDLSQLHVIMAGFSKNGSPSR